MSGTRETNQIREYWEGGAEGRELYQVTVVSGRGKEDNHSSCLFGISESKFILLITPHLYFCQIGFGSCFKMI
jgi:hypothetical protein